MPFINGLLGLSPVPECAIPGILGSTGVLAGGELEGKPLGSGTHRFQAMSKLSEQRTHQARRIAISNQLISAGKDPGVAERWCDAWEAEAALRELKRDADYWERAGSG